jgi:hypothetical protein
MPAAGSARLRQGLTVYDSVSAVSTQSDATVSRIYILGASYCLRPFVASVACPRSQYPRAAVSPHIFYTVNK